MNKDEDTLHPEQAAAPAAQSAWADYRTTCDPVTPEPSRAKAGAARVKPTNTPSKAAQAVSADPEALNSALRTLNPKPSTPSSCGAPLLVKREARPIYCKAATTTDTLSPGAPARPVAYRVGPRRTPTRSVPRTLGTDLHWPVGLRRCILSRGFDVFDNDVLGSRTATAELCCGSETPQMASHPRAMRRGGSCPPGVRCEPKNLGAGGGVGGSRRACYGSHPVRGATRFCYHNLLLGRHPHQRRPVTRGSSHHPGPIR